MVSGVTSNSDDLVSLKERRKKEHLLVIRFSAMGDVAMLVPVLRVLTESYPFLKITVLTREFFSPLFDGIQNVEVYPADLKGRHSGIGGLNRLAKELRKLKITGVADVHNVLRSNVLKTLFFFYGIPVKQIDKGRREKKALTAINNKVFRQLKTTHQRYADVFAELGYPVDLEKCTFSEREPLSADFRNFVENDSVKRIGIAPFAQHEGKVYPQDLMKQVIQELDKESSIQIFLFGGGKTEEAKLHSLEEKYSNVTSRAGKLTFEKELALISNLDLMLSMDSGNGHLAAIFGVPVITLWGVTHPYAGFAPFKQPKENWLLPDLYKYPAIPTSIYGNKYPAGYEDVMRTISPEEVLNKIKVTLAAKN